MKMTRAGYHQRLPAGVILTGGGALTPGIVELAREVFAMPARIGMPGQRLRGLADSVESPRMAVPAGLVLYGARQVALSGGFGTGTPQVAGGREGARSGETVAPGLLLSSARGNQP